MMVPGGALADGDVREGSECPRRRRRPPDGRASSAPGSDLFLGRTDNIDIRLAAAIALLFNVLMVVVAIIAIAPPVPRNDPGVGR